MNTYTKIRPTQVIGPLGLPITIETLPPRGTRRWVARRKAEVLAAIVGGLLSIEEACQRYDLSLEELTLWQGAIERSGILGLRVKSIQRFRSVHAKGPNNRPPAVAEPQPGETLDTSRKLVEVA